MSRLTMLQKNGITNMVCRNEECHTPETYCPCTITDQCECQTLKEVIEKLAHYEDLEEQLEKLFGGKLPLEKVVDNLKRVAQNGEEKLEYARILTNAEAEKWDKWINLEEQGRLIITEVGVGQTVWAIGLSSRMESGIFKVVKDVIKVRVEDIFDALRYSRSLGDTVFLTREKAKKALAELKEMEECNAI